MLSRVLILSDTHFTDGQDPLLARVIATARALDLRGTSNSGESGDAVVMAGDVFDLYVGNKRYFREQFAAWHALVAEWLERGVRVAVVEGNHDFQLEGVYPAAVTLHPESCSLELVGGKHLWIEHGDLVDASDIGYRVLRAFLRSPFMRAFIAHAPDSWVQWVGEKFKAASAAHHPRQPDAEHQERLRKIYHAAAEKKFAEGFAFVVMGHCHDLDAHKTLGGEYLNMGYPRVHTQLTIFREGRLERLPVP